MSDQNQNKSDKPFWHRSEIKLALMIALVLAAGFALTRNQDVGPSAAPLSRSEEIQQGCEREFGTEGPDAVRECQTQLLLEEYQATQADKLDRARR